MLIILFSVAFFQCSSSTYPKEAKPFLKCNSGRFSKQQPTTSINSSYNSKIFKNGIHLSNKFQINHSSYKMYRNRFLLIAQSVNYHTPSNVDGPDSQSATSRYFIRGCRFWWLTFKRCTTLTSVKKTYDGMIVLF